MEEELIQEYLRRFNQTFSLLNNEENSTCWEINLSASALRNDSQLYADSILNGEDDEEDIFRTGVLVFYGFRLGAIKLKGKNEFCTHQHGYIDDAIWNFSLDDILNEEVDEENRDSAVSHIVKWATNPGSNTEVSEAILGKMIVPMVKNICKMISPGKRAQCTVVLPPLSEDIEIQDWSSVFTDIKTDGLEIKISNYGSLFNLKEDERKYVIQHQTDGSQEYVVVSAYEIIRGHNSCLGSLAFDVEDSDRQYRLRDINPISLQLSSKKNKYIKDNKEEKINVWEYKKCRFPVSSGFNSFLGSHVSSFGREMFKPTGITDEKRGNANSILEVFNDNEALQAVEVCSRFLKEQNLYNISLGDLVYVADVLERNHGFKKVDISTKKAYKLGTYKNFATSVDINRIPEIPANYATFSWAIRDKKRKVIPYYGLNPQKHNDKQIIESVIDYYDHCTTEMIAEEVLYHYRNGEDPSAFFVAKVFLYLSQMETIMIESCNELVTSIENVDNVEYKELDKSQIKVTNVAQKPDTNKKSSSNNNVKSDIFSIPIEKMNFTVKTYNCLKRAQIRTVRDIVDCGDRLIKVRNLGKSNLLEIREKLHNLGIEI